MKEFHALKNPDGTYKLTIPTEVDNGGEVSQGKIIVPRAKLSIECLADFSTGDLMTFIMEDN